MSAITDAEFAAVAACFHRMCGLVLPAGKQYLVTQRLGGLLDGDRLATWSDLVAALDADPHGSLAVSSIHAITTHETSWFRDPGVFASIGDELLPELGRRVRARRQRPARRRGAQVSIWCAAVSTGQEAYSLAMQIDRYVERERDIALDDFLILGTDISAPVLAQAMQGVYDEFELGRGLDAVTRDAYFEPVGRRRWRVRERLRSIVQFQAASLIEPFAHAGGFDLILCRNVLIYFDTETRARIVDRCARTLAPDGILMLGGSECLMPVPPAFRVERHPRATFYRRV